MKKNHEDDRARDRKIYHRIAPDRFEHIDLRIGRAGGIIPDRYRLPSFKMKIAHSVKPDRICCKLKKYNGVIAFQRIAGITHPFKCKYALGFPGSGQPDEFRHKDDQYHANEERNKKGEAFYDEHGERSVAAGGNVIIICSPS